MFGAARFLLLQEAPAPLARFHADLSAGIADPSDAFPAFRDFCLGNRQEVVSVLTTRLMQTNEVGRCAYLLPAFRTGNGAETAAHLRENEHIVLMFCAFEGEPNIVPLHGKGEVLTPASPKFAALASAFPPNPGARALMRVSVSRVSTSCGFAVPFMEFWSDRDALDEWAAGQGAEKLGEYRHRKNARSIDGMPAL